LALLKVADCGSFPAWWNIPIQICSNAEVFFDLDQFNIIHNTGNTNNGDKVNIFYRPGAFPYYDAKNQSINGGIPQEGNLTQHVDIFLQQLADNEPEGFDGISVLDFEQYLPKNNGYLSPVAREASRQWVRDRRPDWEYEQVQKASKVTFDIAVRPFFKSLLKKNTELYPEAMVGYYHYPYCNNWEAPYTQCKQSIVELNDYIQDFIFNMSTALFPDAYAFEEHGDGFLDYLTTLLDETVRVNINGLPMLPYYWYRFHAPSTAILPDEEAILILWTLRAYGMDGVVLWGSTDDLHNAEDCAAFRDYLYTFLGPVLKCLDELPSAAVAAIADLLPVFDRTAPGVSSLHLRKNWAPLVSLLKNICELP